MRGDGSTELFRVPSSEFRVPRMKVDGSKELRIRVKLSAAG